MAPDNTHTVFGFDCALNWRPTVFVNGISSNRVCSACGLVPSKIAMLPCRHVLCQPCYDRCLANAGKCCLDGEDILRDDVVWSALSVVSLLGRQIRCWNASKGCDFSGPASAVLEHFSKACQHHAVPCPRCKRSIVHKDIVSHCQWGLCIQIPAVESGTRKDGTSGVAQITNALSNLDAKVTSLQSSLQEDLRRVANSVEVSSEQMNHCLPVLESIHGLDNTLKESMQLSGQAVAEITEAQAALQNNTSAIMGSLQMVLDIVNELRASRNQAAGERSMTAQSDTCDKEAGETLSLKDLASDGNSSKMQSLQNGTCDEKPCEISASQNGTCNEKSSEDLALKKQDDIAAEEVKNTVAPENQICGEESSQTVTLPSQMCSEESAETLQDCTCGKESHEALGPQIVCKEASETLALANLTCAVESSQTVASPPSTCGGESSKTSALQNQACNKDLTEVLLQMQLCGERLRQTSASFNQTGSKESSEILSPQDQTLELGTAMTLQSQICSGEPSETLPPKQQTCDEDSSNALSPQDQIQDQGTALASQDQVCGEGTSEALASQSKVSSKESSDTSGTQQLMSEPSETLAGQNSICGKESSEPLAACANLKREVDQLATASAAERNEIKEKLKAIEKMIQDCVRTGSMNQSNVELFRREFRDKMRCLGPVSKWSFNNKLNVSKTLEWTVESWSDAKAQSRLLGSKTIYPEHADYFYGYRILPSAVFETKNRFQSVTMGFQICRGTHDGLVMWPMKKTMCLMLVNPADRSRFDSVVLNTADLDGEAYDRPGDDDNVELVCGEKVSVRKLEGKGCVHNDRLSLQFYIMA